MDAAAEDVSAQPRDDDHHLVKRAQAGDTGAMADLLDRHFDYVHHRARLPGGDRYRGLRGADPDRAGVKRDTARREHARPGRGVRGRVEPCVTLGSGVHRALLDELLDVSMLTGRQLVRDSSDALDGVEDFDTWLRQAG
jgi:hypothetical protein